MSLSIRISMSSVSSLNLSDLGGCPKGRPFFKLRHEIYLDLLGIRGATYRIRQELIQHSDLFIQECTSLDNQSYYVRDAWFNNNGVCVLICNDDTECVHLSFSYDNVGKFVENVRYNNVEY